MMPHKLCRAAIPREADSGVVVVADLPATSRFGVKTDVDDGRWLEAGITVQLKVLVQPVVERVCRVEGIAPRTTRRPALNIMSPVPGGSIVVAVA